MSRVAQENCERCDALTPHADIRSLCQLCYVELIEGSRRGPGSARRAQVGKAYTVLQVAEVLAVSARTIREMIAAGEITAVNMARTGASGPGARYRIAGQEVGRLVATRVVRPGIRLR